MLILTFCRKKPQKDPVNHNTTVLHLLQIVLGSCLATDGMESVWLSLFTFSTTSLTNFDVLDRGNGFEKKLFQRLNERKRKGLESYQWSVDDM